MWQLINSLANNKNKTDTAPTRLDTPSGTLTNAKEICEHFNSFFANIGSMLANDILTH